MSALKYQDQGINILSQMNYLSILIDPFLFDRKSQGFALETCKQSFSGSRDKAGIMGLLDTGARAQELLNLNLEDVELASGSVLIRQGKGRTPRMVFLGRKTIRAIRVYFRFRRDANPALWVSIHGDRVTYTALRLLLRRRAVLAELYSS